MTRERLFLLLAALVMVAAGWWISNNTEWAEEDVPRPATGEARDNPVYAFEQILRKLGMHAEHHERLDGMPPEGARLVLLSSSWALVPERAAQMRAWVERGGHLVLVQGTDWDGTRLADWVPVDTVYITERAAFERAAAEAAAKAKRRQAAPGVREGAGERPHGSARSEADESNGQGAENRSVEGSEKGGDDEGEGDEDDGDTAVSEPPVFGEIESLDLCSQFAWTRRLTVKAGHQVEWMLTQNSARQLVRVAQGRGSVTVLNADPRLFQGRMPFGCDLSLVLAASVRAAPGATAWIYLDEKREPLLPWLWHTGWIAVVLTALALAAALWRSAVRFGPRLAAPPRLRRSISEQVSGMGAYLHRHGRDALLVAQQRALEDAATRIVRGYARLPLADRVHAIAAATGVARDDLYTAMASTFCTRAELPARLQLLETARRLLIRRP